MTRLLILSCIAAGLLAGAVLAEKGGPDPHSAPHGKARGIVHKKIEKSVHKKGIHPDDPGLHKGHAPHDLMHGKKDLHGKIKPHVDKHHADKHHEKVEKHLEHADKHAEKGHDKQAHKHAEKALDLHKKGAK